MTLKKYIILIILNLISFNSAIAEDSVIKRGELSGYMLSPLQHGSKDYNAGFSMYVSAWPLLETYPGRRFQSGLFSTWMFAQYDGEAPKKMYSDIEGGLGWWTGTNFPRVTPKFIMGGVAPNFAEWANGPGAGKGRNWNKTQGKYAVAQLTPWLLFPPDGLNLRKNSFNKLFGYGYLPLPLTDKKNVTNNQEFPTGDNSWTLFLNTGNFKGPVAFFTPYFWSKWYLKDPSLSGKLLDSRPSDPNKSLQMETPYIPAVYAKGGDGNIYAKISKTLFPRWSDNSSVVAHKVTSYNKNALWEDVYRWFHGGFISDGKFDSEGSNIHKFGDGGSSTWRIEIKIDGEKKKFPINWESFGKPKSFNSESFGYKWGDKVSVYNKNKSLFALPEYFLLINDSKQKKWTAISEKNIPDETGLKKYSFKTRIKGLGKTMRTPINENSVWKNPGPVAGPFKANLEDESTVTYYWYKFSEQPSLLKADLSDKERHLMQKRVEELHRFWKKDRQYISPPAIGTLADIDPNLLVKPPRGLEIGYVPIVTKQEISK